MTRINSFSGSGINTQSIPEFEGGNTCNHLNFHRFFRGYSNWKGITELFWNFVKPIAIYKCTKNFFLNGRGKNESAETLSLFLRWS